MFKKLLVSLSIAMSLAACSTPNHTQNYEKPKNLLFNNKELNTYPVLVERDNKLCSNDKKDDQKCPIKFYINDFKAGDFYINNQTTYYLKPNEYLLTVKNCNTKCDTYHTKLNIDNQYKTVNLLLSIDENGKPIIIRKN